MEELYKTVEIEQCEPLYSTNITGEVPSWLGGDLFRNGPGKFEFGDTSFKHLFDGSALIHRFHINNQIVTYQNKFVKSDAYCKNKAANRIVVGEFGTIAHPDPCKSLFRRIFSYFKPEVSTDNTLVNVFKFGDALFAVTETNVMRQIDPVTLETMDKLDLMSVASVNGATAHPHFDKDGTYHNLGSIYKGKPHYAIFKMTPKVSAGEEVASGGEEVASGGDDLIKSVEIVAKIPSQWKYHPSYHHSFAMTENYYVIVESPFVVSIFTILTAKLRGHAFSDALQWLSEYPTKFHIVCKKSGNVVNHSFTYTSQAFFAFHHINAFEEANCIVLDLCCTTDMESVQLFTVKMLQEKGIKENLKEINMAKPWRFVLPLQLANRQEDGDLNLKVDTTASATMYGLNVKLHPEILFDLCFDFPQINYCDCNSRPYRFAYGVGTESSFADTLYKLDLKTRRHQQWHEAGHYPSEPVFVAKPGGKDEDEGVILSVVLTTGRKRSAHLLILDAHTFTELARAVFDVKICRDFHGSFNAA